MHPHTPPPIGSNKSSAVKAMTDVLGWLEFQKFLIELSKRVAQSKNELDSMDAECGDGDFGSTIAAAFEHAAKTVEEASGNDIGALLVLD